MKGNMSKREPSEMGLALKVYRKKKQLTQEAFAQLLGISLSTLRAWEQGQTHPDRTTAVFIKLWLESTKKK